MVATVENKLVFTVLTKRARFVVCGDDYTQYSAVYLKERKEVDAKLEELDRLLAEQKAKTEHIQKFAQIAGKCLDFKEMTKPMLNELIDKIVVHQCDKSTGKRSQKVEVYYRFMGLIE